METNFALPMDLVDVRPSNIRTPKITKIGAAAKTRAMSQARAEEKTKTFVISKGFVFSLFLVLGVMFVITFSSARLTQLSDNNIKMERQLGNLRQQERELDAQITGGMSLGEVESYAREQLGMIKIDNTQVEYINMSGSDRVWLAQEEQGAKTGFLASAGKYLNLVFEYIN